MGGAVIDVATDLTFRAERASATFSGPVEGRDKINAALANAGFQLLPDRAAGALVRPWDTFGLPAWANPSLADDQGAPNAGHTPGTKHPDTGKPYVDDPRVGFSTVLLDDEGDAKELNRAVSLLGKRSGWRLRRHATGSMVAERADDAGQAELVSLRQEMDWLRQHCYTLKNDGSYQKLPPRLAGGAVNNPPAYMQTGSHSAQLFRQALSTLIGSGGGVMSASGLNILQTGGGSMNVTITGGVPGGQVWVPGTTTAGVQGLYYCYNDASVTLSISASNPTNNRIDTIVAQVQDAAYAGSTNAWQLAVVTGTPTAGANLTNLNGKGTVPASSYVVGYVEVDANVTSIVTAKIKYVATVAGLAGTMLAGAEVTLLDQQTIGNGPGSAIGVVLHTFPTVCTSVKIGGTSWYSNTGRTTLVNPGGSWARYYPSGANVLGDYYNPSGFTLIYPVTFVTATGY